MVLSSVTVKKSGSFLSMLGYGSDVAILLATSFLSLRKWKNWWSAQTRCFFKWTLEFTEVTNSRRCGYEMSLMEVMSRLVMNSLNPGNIEAKTLRGTYSEITGIAVKQEIFYSF